MILVESPYAACYCGCYATRLQLHNATLATGEQRGLHFLTSAAGFWQYLADERPKWVVLTSHSLVHDLAFITTIRAEYGATRLIVCVLPTSPPPALLWPMLQLIEPEALCTPSELQACLEASWEMRHFRSCLLPVFSQLPPTQQFEVVPSRAFSSLTKAEVRVVRELLNGLSRQQMAAYLFISPRTVDNHKANIAKKLGAAAVPYGLTKYLLQHKQQFTIWVEAAGINK